jgi:hypothetical protein
MFKRKINLQLFADDPATTSTVEATSTTAGEPATAATNPQTQPASSDEKKYSDNDLDTIMKGRTARWKKEMEEAVATARKEAEERAKMTAEQKQQYDAEQFQKEREAFQKEKDEFNQIVARAEQEKIATNLLRQGGFDATEDVLQIVTGADETDTKARFDAFAKVVEKQLKKAEVERATGTTPKAVTNNGNVMSEIEKRIAKYK